MKVIWQNSSMQRILIFDSGAGALSVFQEISLSEPDIHCTLALDNARFPYGTLTESQLIARVVKVVGELIRQTTPELAVIACNTASTLVLEELRKQFDIPFVGVVPAIKPAAKLSNSQTIGLLATPATIERSYTENLIEDFAPNCEILRVGSTELVYMAEQKIRSKAVDIARLKDIMAPFIDHSECDVLVLACTHFPLLKDELAEVLPARIKMLDSGSAIAQRVSSLLKKEKQQTGNFPSHQERHKKPYQVYFTCPDTEIQAMGNYFGNLGFEFAQPKVIVL